MEPSAPPRRGLSLPTKILLGLIVGAAAGVTLNVMWATPLGAAKTPEALRLDQWANMVKPLGDLFLNLLFMIVVPIVFSSLFLGVAGLSSVQKLGSLGSRTLLWFLLTTAFAASLGILLVRVFEPGKGLSPEATAKIKAEYVGAAQEKIAQGGGVQTRLQTLDAVLPMLEEAKVLTPEAAAKVKADYHAAAQKKIAESGEAHSWLRLIVDIVPRNVVDAAGDNTKVLGLIFFALVLGAAAIRIPPERTRMLREVFETLYELCVGVMAWVMKLAPYGVAALIFHATAKLGLDVMKLVGFYFLTAMGGLVCYQLVVVTLLAKVFAGISPGRFYRGIRTLLVTAFSTSSSNATLPTTMRTATDEFGAPKEIAGFVIPLGATMNMNGTALFEGVSVLFLAQVYGLDLDVGTQMLVIGLAVLTAIGAAGVPGGSLPLLAIVLTQVGVPAEMLALILGVDRLVDMTRTVPNVTSDLVCTLWLARRDGHALKT